MPKKIIVPNVEFSKSDIILDASDIIFPEGYKQYWLNSNQWTLIDSHGRINISYMFNWAKVQNPNITNKEPHRWLVNKSTKELRANYQNLLGFDPVNTVNGGKRVSDNSQTPNSGFENPVSNNGALTNISANGNVQNYGTYMTKRMLIAYASWVSFEFQCIVLDIFVENYGSEIDGNSLIMPKDELYNEHIEVNMRHTSLLTKRSKIPVNLQAPKELTKNISDYVTWLKTDFNIDISLVEFYKFLCHYGIFYKDALAEGGEEFDLYQPKMEHIYIENPFFVSVPTVVEGKEIYTIYILKYGHDMIISDIVKAFPQIKPDTV